MPVETGILKVAVICSAFPLYGVEEMRKLLWLKALLSAK